MLTGAFLMTSSYAAGPDTPLQSEVATITSNITSWVFDLDDTLADSAMDFEAWRVELGACQLNCAAAQHRLQAHTSTTLVLYAYCCRFLVRFPFVQPPHLCIACILAPVFASSDRYNSTLSIKQRPFGCGVCGGPSASPCACGHIDRAPFRVSNIGRNQQS